MKCEDITVENVKDAWKRVRVDVPLKTVLSKQPDDWINSSILIANKLRKSGVLQKNMMYHRNSEVMKSIYKTAREVFKNEGVPFKEDKWNPSDIFADAMFGKFDLNKKSVNGLNQSLMQLFKEKKLVGISLKKATKIVKLEVFNNGQRKEININPRFELRGGRTARASFQSSNKTTLFLGNRLALNGRFFDFHKNWAYQIDGLKAFGGRIGIGPVNFILKEYGEEQVNWQKILKNVLKEDLDNSDTKEWYRFFSQYESGTEWSYAEFLEFLNEKRSDAKGSNWVGSKIIGMYVGDRIMKSTHRDDIIYDILNYARGATKTSSVFIKAS